MKHMNRFIILLLIALSFSSASLLANTQKPLLMEGKNSLFQRILSTPGASLSTQPGTAGQEPSTPFTAFYVYARQDVDGKEWLEVGTNRHGEGLNWLPAAQSIEWNQGLTAAFRTSAGQDRTLLFADKAALRELVENKDVDRYADLYQEAVLGIPSETSPVIAIQPEGELDIHEDFYLVPIRRHEDIYLGNEQARMLNISSVPLSESTTVKTTAPPTKKQPSGAKRDGYSSGLVFAIDSTLSMDPYIDRTRDAVMKIYDHLGDAGLLGNVNFGLVSFRDDPVATPGLDYRTETLVTLEEGRNPGAFLSKINKLSAANVSSMDFIEDSYAGIKDAIESIDWSGHDAKYIVLVTDAGPRGPGDPLSGTGLSTQALRQLALDKGIAIFVLHLLTPNNMANHASAAQQYRQLSEIPGIGSLYYGVPTGNVEEFGQVLDALASQITNQVKLAIGGQLSPIQSAGTGNVQLARLQSKVSKLGHALRMKYLRKSSNEQIPTVIDAWILDRDFNNPENPTLDVRVLLTRDQLSDLHDILRQVLNTAEEGLLSPKNFLDELKSLAATTTRDPARLGTTTAITAGEGQSLANLGFMREYIEDLPYSGKVMGISLEDWQSWSARRQIRFLHGLEEKISYYHALHDHTDLWISLDGGPVNGDSVFPIALDMLP